MNEPIICEKCGLKHYEGNCRLCGKPFKASWVLQVFCPKPARCKVNYFNKKTRDKRRKRRDQYYKPGLSAGVLNSIEKLREKAEGK